MQNFGMQGANQSAQPGGGQMYNPGCGGSLIGPGPPMPQVVSHVPVTVQMNNFKSVLTQWNQQQQAAIHAMGAQQQLSPEQLHMACHQLNERCRQAYASFQNQLAQMQQRIGASGQVPSTGGAWRGAPPGTMPPPMPPGQMQREMTPADKKKMMEMQKRMAAQQAQQGMRPGFPPGTTPQQQQQIQARMQAMQQQQNMQNNGYRMMQQQPGQAGQTPQYPGGPLHPSHQQLQHMQPPSTPQSHGPASVSNAAQQQYQQQQQQQQQQYYQQQQSQQQQLHMQQQQQLQMQQQQAQQHQQQQQMAQQQGMAQDGSGFQQPQMPQHAQQNQMQQMQHQQQIQQQQQQQPVAPPQPAPAPAQKPEDTRYKELLREMKNQYLEVLEGMQRRQTQQKGLVQMINILQGDRTVPYEQLVGLKSSLHRLMIRDCPTFPMMEEIRKVVFKRKEDRERAMMMSFNSKEIVEGAEKRLLAKKLDDALGVASWKSVKHLTIRVPEAIRKLTERTTSPSPLEEKRKALKRENDVVADEEGVVAKKPKKEESRDETTSQTSADEDFAKIATMFVVKTVFDTRAPWIIPAKAREELRQLSSWNIDEHCLPSCSNAPFVIICVKAQSLLVNPLRISLPHSYPIDAATVQFDRSFPQDSDYGPALQKLFEKYLGTKSAVKGLTDFVEAYQAACEEYQIYLPKYQVESSPEQQKTPEMVYATHYAARPAATAPIAHKGMVM